MKTLVVYFSRKGYVKKVAEEQAEIYGAELVRLVSTERTAGILGFWWCGRFGMHRWGMPIEPVPVDVSAYDKVIFCAPIWVYTVCAPMWEFIGQCAGKVKSAEYVLVHFSLPMRFPRTAARMDRALGIHHTAFTSVLCPWGIRLACRRWEEPAAQQTAKEKQPQQ